MMKTGCRSCTFALIYRKICIMVCVLSDENNVSSVRTQVAMTAVQIYRVSRIEAAIEISLSISMPIDRYILTIYLSRNSKIGD